MWAVTVTTTKCHPLQQDEVLAASILVEDVSNFAAITDRSHQGPDS
jgi:hypothetical protein